MNAEERSTRIVLTDRKKLEIDGVLEILRFDEEELLVRTTRGELCAGGRELHISLLSLESGQIELDGDIDALIFEDERQKKKGRLFGRKE